MRKNKLLIAAAVAAITAGSSVAFAQGTPGAGQGDKANGASHNAPAEKMSPSGQKSGGAAEHSQRGEEKNERSTVGQGQNNKAGENKAGQANERNNMGQANERNERNKTGQANERNKKSETTGQAPGQSNQPAAQSNQKQQDKLKSNAEQNKMKANEKAGQEQKNRATTGQGAPENRSGTMQNRGENNMQNRSGSETRGGAMENRENRGSSSTAVEGREGGSVNLSSEQRTKIHSIIVSERSAPRVAHVDFDVHPGVVVPRGRVKLAPIPSSIVEIEPSWRGYEYFLVGDQIVVVDPGTLRIIAVLPA